MMPIPRLRHVQVYEQVRLAGETSPRIVLRKCAKYAYFNGLKASLCTPVNKDDMVFQGPHGWRVKHD